MRITEESFSRSILVFADKQDDEIRNQAAFLGKIAIGVFIVVAIWKLITRNRE